MSSEYLARKFPKLDEWVAGTTMPTLKQLETFARATYTPVGYLFLTEPPSEPLPLHDFRTRGARAMGTASPNLLDTIYECEGRQEWYHDFAIANGEEPSKVVGSTSIDHDPVATGTTIRALLQFEPGSRGSSWSEAFRCLSERAEEVGILVMTSGVVGSNTHRPLDPEEFGGFTLVDPVAPVVFVNGADTKAAQIFTLAHELAHVWLGGSALDDAQPGQGPSQAIEQWCNTVAGELLVPGTAVAERTLGQLDADELDTLAAEFRVSTLVVLRRLLDIGRLTQQMYWARYDSERARLADLTASSDRGCQGPLSSARGRSWELPGDGHEICPVVAMGSAPRLATIRPGVSSMGSPLDR